MPHAHSGAPTEAAGDDLGSTDEVKVFKDEGDVEDEKRSSELLEEKSSLIDLTESENPTPVFNPFRYFQEKSGEPYSSKLTTRADHSPVFGKLETPPHSGFNMGYLMPYPYPNGAAGHPLPVSMVSTDVMRFLTQGKETSKMGLTAAGGLPLFCHNGDLGQPPPAHMGIPPYQLDKAAIGLTRPAMYPFAGGAYPYPMLGPEMSQVAASWHTPSMYPISSAASGFRSPYPTSLPITSSSLTSELYRFSPGLIAAGAHPLSPHPLHPLAAHPHPHSHHGPPHPLAHPHGSSKGSDLPSSDLLNHRYSRGLDKSSSGSHDKSGDGSTGGPGSAPGTPGTPAPGSGGPHSNDKTKKPHIKKPLNAFMLYMKEMRAKVVAECTLKESAAINQILGRRWHSLSRDEQAKYYEKARQERQIHMQLYPGWSARDNYGYGSKKKKRKKERSPADLGGNNLKKCRARYGLEQQSQWCKPCRRKKKCIRYMEALAAACGGCPPPSEGDDVDNDGDMDGDDGDAGSDSDSSSVRDRDGSLSSPALSALSSLTSPSALLPSPASLASPAARALPSPLPPLDMMNDQIQLKPPTPGQPSSAPHAPTPRLPVGTNPRDANNPLSVNRLTSRSCGLSSLNLSHLAALRSNSATNLSSPLLPFSPDFSKAVPSTSNSPLLSDYTRNAMGGFGQHLLNDVPRSGNGGTSNGVGSSGGSNGKSKSTSSSTSTNNPNNSNKVISVS
ncbi:transcription factor pangolin isoform X2 [Arctopsyche grandis]|uniref:transcription factor pangolin isoform X2 n=1 Tax=Arctopsyche grandis TaxID=121162 RepID=UPI00406D94B2